MFPIVLERDGDLRVVDESGEDHLFAADRFVPAKVPSAVKMSLADGFPGLTLRRRNAQASFPPDAVSRCLQDGGRSRKTPVNVRRELRGD